MEKVGFHDMTEGEYNCGIFPAWFFFRVVSQASFTAAHYILMPKRSQTHNIDVSIYIMVQFTKVKNELPI